MQNNDHDEIERLLKELTEWQRMSGISPGQNSDFLSLGETNAAIEDLEYKLAQLGARYHWSRETQEYILDPNDFADLSL